MSQLRQFQHQGSTYVSLDDIETGVQTHQKESTTPFRLSPSMSQVSFPLNTVEGSSGDTWIELQCALRLLQYYSREEAESELLPVIGALSRALKENVQQKRAAARKYRWLVAWRQNYRCAGPCGDLLYPLAFDIDHKTELRDGGEDVYSASGDDNLQALCSNCHAAKTRSFHSAKSSSESTNTGQNKAKRKTNTKNKKKKKKKKKKPRRQ